MQMKNSNIDWIGDIPINWKLFKGKNVFVQRSEKGNEIVLQLLSPTQKFGVIPQTKYEELSGMSAVKMDPFADLSLLKTIHKGDYCISLRSFQGGFEYSLFEGVVSPAYQVFYPKINIDDGYFKYLFKCGAFISKMCSYSMTLRDGKNISFSDFGDTYIPYPPLGEQSKIAAFLDSKTSEIKSLIDNLNKQIESLKEYKKSLIYKCVTKGLDDSVPLKDSGIEWIGQIPENWKIERLQWHLREIKENNNPIKADKVLSLTNKNGVIPYEEKGAQGNVSKEDYSQYKLAYPDTIVTNSMNILIGSVGICNYFGCVSPVYYVYKANNQSNLKFINYLFQTIPFQKELRKYANGILEIRLRVSSDDILKRQVCFPSLEEQNQIVDFLDNKCGKIDELISMQEAEIDNLIEYQKSLIYEYVTGKKEVV